MVNDINKGDCLVELTFETRGSNYLIRRGLAPALFEIYENDELLDSNTLKKDLQTHLEENILHLNQKTFGQTCILGTSSYVPFMQLEAAKRREVVDDVLQVAVFTKMSELAKEELSLTNSNIRDKEYQLSVAKTEHHGQSKILQVLNENKSIHINQHQEELNNLESSKKSMIIDFRKLKEEYDKLKSKDLEKEYYVDTLSEITQTKNSISKIERELESLESLEYCYSCKHLS